MDARDENCAGRWSGGAFSMVTGARRIYNPRRPRRLDLPALPRGTTDGFCAHTRASSVAHTRASSVNR
jgi:hypothetical protein